MIDNARSALLRVVADRLGGTATMPSALEGLAAPHTPSLYFHDAGPDALAPWLERFGAKFTTRTDIDTRGSLAPFTVTTYRGQFYGLPVELRVCADR